MKKLLNITKVIAVRPGVLRVTWDDGVTLDADVSGLLNGHVLLDMLNVPEVFSDISVVEGGGGVEWANGADFSSNMLRTRAEDQKKSREKLKA
ncbi:MAG: DUF2442 domain-containing protein [Paracoccaceae bacterium]